MIRKKQYKDMEKYAETHRRQKNKYYRRTQCGWHPWEKWQDDIVLKHELTDHQISTLVGHSVCAVQHRRHRLKKWGYGND